jgi:hypothetical protein
VLQVRYAEATAVAKVAIIQRTISQVMMTSKDTGGSATAHSSL